MKILILITGVASSILWLASSLVTVRERYTDNTGEFEEAAIIVDGKDFIATARKQAKLNSYAAAFSSLTAILQILNR